MAQADHRYRIPAYRGDAPFAFVSYAHEDSVMVFAELDVLAAEGVRFYYDEGIHPGHTWDDELAEAIERSAVFVFFVTSHAPASPNCRREIAFAIDHGKPVLAVHLQDVELPATQVVDRQSASDRAFAFRRGALSGAAHCGDSRTPGQR